ncbi:MAG: hypothetical protein WC003_05410 [Terrimicrobiaceae bacterium]
MENELKPALIIGNGPSVDQLDPKIFDHFTTFGCNHICKKFPDWGRETDNVVITDSNRIREIGSAYKDYKGGLFIGDERYANPPVKRIREIIGRDFVPLRQLKKETLDRIPQIDGICWHKLLFSTVFHKLRFTFDFDRGLNFGYSVVTSAIQIAAIQGHKTILLTGVDSSYNSDKDYFKGMVGKIDFVNYDFIKNPRLFMEPVLALAQVYLEELGVRLIDCTPGGKLQFISKGSFATLPPFFKIDRDIKYPSPL